MKRNNHRLAAGTLAASVLVALGAYASSRAIEGAARAIEGAAPATLAIATTSAHSAANAPAARAAQNRRMPLATAPAQTGFDRFIVKYRDGSAARRSPAALTDQLNAALRRAGISGSTALSTGARATLSLSHVRKLGVGADVVRATRKLNKAEADAFLKQLRADPAVQYAQPDYMKHRLDVVPNDPHFADLQWDYTDPVGGIKAPTAWDTSQGEGVVVAVIDTGYVDHSDLNDNVIPGYDFISLYGQDDENPDVAGDGDGRDADAHDPGDWVDSTMPWCGGSSSSSWHGTHVAGTVAAVTNNGIGVAGVAYKAKVQPVRVLGHCGGTTSDIADAITWASGGEVDGAPANTSPAEVINMSLGGGGACSDDPATQEAIDGAISRGVTVVVAAGNDGSDAANFSPASCKGVVTVGATGIDGAKSWFSNYGATVTLSAPGGNATSGGDSDEHWIWSLGNSGAKEPVAGADGEVLMGFIGTSQASPHVAGVVAMMQSAAIASGKPALTPAQVKNILRGTARAFPVTPPVSTPMGAGILDAAAAAYAATQDVSDETAELLSNRVAMTAQTGAAGDELLYRIEVPAGTRSLNLRSYGGSGDVSLYVSYDNVPTTSVFDRKSAKAGNSEAVVITNPAAGTYYLRIVGEQAFANVSVMGLYQ